MSGPIQTPSPPPAGNTPPKSVPPLMLKNVRVQDFRGLKDLHLELEPLTLLVGENNSGKSSLLAALGVFFGSIRPTEDDLHVDSGGVRAKRFVIDVKFVPWDGTEFNPDIQARFLGRIQFPQDKTQARFFTIRTIGEFDIDGVISLERRFVIGWADTRQAAMALALAPERPGREQLETISFFMLDARRDLVEELRTRTSHWGRLLADLALAPAQRADIEKSLEEIGNAIVASSPVLDSVRTGLAGVREALGSSVADVAISPVPGRIDELGRAVDVLLTRPKGASLPLRLQGHGSRSLAAVMVFESFIKQRIAGKGPLPPLVVAAFEEPEAHLHPQAHRAMLSIIAGLGGQKIVSTHSPHVARVADIHCIRSIVRDAAGAPQCAMVPRTIGGVATFSDAELVHVRRFVQRNNGEVLFARVVIVFEGETEDFALPIFAKHFWKKEHGLLGVSFAHTDGAGNGKHVVRILEALRVPWILLADGDQKGSEGVASIEGAINRKILATEMVQLPKDCGFESYLVQAGYRVPMESAIADHFGKNELTACRVKWAKQRGPKGVKRDYSSVGWEDRLVSDFCTSKKGTIGEALAEGLLKHAAQSNLAPIPPLVEQVFQLAQRWLA
jgi:putative ATP-dependent endonuclease of the OLD family